jgi:ABC-type nitrate/sulfonate/bicarbonate transport system permease component
MGLGALVGAAFGEWGIGLLIGAVLGIPLGIFLVYFVYSRAENA